MRFKTQPCCPSPMPPNSDWGHYGIVGINCCNGCNDWVICGYMGGRRAANHELKLGFLCAIQRAHRSGIYGDHVGASTSNARNSLANTCVRMATNHKTATLRPSCTVMNRSHKSPKKAVIEIARSKLLVTI